MHQTIQYMLNAMARSVANDIIVTAFNKLMTEGGSPNIERILAAISCAFIYFR